MAVAVDVREGDAAPGELDAGDARERGGSDRHEAGRGAARSAGEDQRAEQHGGLQAGSHISRKYTELPSRPLQPWVTVHPETETGPGPALVRKYVQPR